MKYVLDTNTVSYLMRGDEKVVRELTSRRRTDVLVPQPVIAEIRYGLARLERSSRRTRLEKRLDLFLRELQRAEWSDGVSSSFGQIKADLERQGTRLEDFDVAVAAHALACEGTLVTANVHPMERVSGIRIENWADQA